MSLQPTADPEQRQLPDRPDRARSRIYAFAEYYPDPFKPYVDTQFADWVEHGHALEIFAFGSWGDVGNRPVSRYRLADRTTYLPGRTRDVARAVPRAMKAIAARPGRFLRLQRGEHGPLRRRVLHLSQAVLLPTLAPDLCLIHNLTTATRLGSLRTLYPSARIAIYYHGGETAGPMSAADATAAFAGADIVFTNTEYSRQSARARGCDDAKIRIVPLGYDLREFAKRADRPYKPLGTLRLVAVSRLSREKGLLVLLDALAMLEGDAQSIRCTIVGDGPERGALETRVRALGLGDRVTFAGLLPRHGVLDAFHESDALVLPSIPTDTWEENQACVLQEAMLSRLLVLTTRTGGVPESIAPAMHEFASDPGDAPALASRIRRLLTMSVGEFDVLGRSNRAYCEARYDVRTLNDHLLRAALGQPAVADRSIPLTSAGFA